MDAQEEEQGRKQALLAWFNEGDTRAYKIRFPNGTVDVFSWLGQRPSIKASDGEGSDHPYGEGHQCGPSVNGRRSQYGDGGNQYDCDACQLLGGERAEHHADRGIPAGGRNDKASVRCQRIKQKPSCRSVV